MTLVLEDPGGTPFDRLLGRPLDVSHFLRIGEVHGVRHRLATRLPDRTRWCAPERPAARCPFPRDAGRPFRAWPLSSRFRFESPIAFHAPHRTVGASAASNRRRNPGYAERSPERSADVR